ncbi:hypothetical protein QBZ16_002479 [Prototheca wickerhamii]|uniref:AAA+ ATPase domain-containing protein n=1 Tax=Prototheca wickerhamii TaxID=3111 RepID=A0AAD9IM09_PROWI|nr:hypothetical protein QBZ16_002479 [Prototheca wickerhamii]
MVTARIKEEIAADCVACHESALAAAAGKARTMSEESAALVRSLQRVIETLQHGLVERDTEVRLMLLAALAQEHILLIGPPGTAKSELGRRLARLFDGVFFERLLTRFSVPEELFGPLSMKALERDEYRRQTESYLPSATVAFIDEIFKANSAILNSLLTIINERLFDNGSAREHVPLQCLVGASNELPESEELEALYDRFLIRRAVTQVSGAGLMELLGSGGPRAGSTPQLVALARPGDDSGEPPAPALLRGSGFQGLRERAAREVEVPARILQLLIDLRAHMQSEREPATYISDRRLVKAVVLLQDEHHITAWLLDHIAAEAGLRQPQFLLKSLFGRACAAAVTGKRDVDLLEEITALRTVLLRKLTDILTLIEDDVRGVSTHLWFGRADTRRFVTSLKPKLTAAAQATERLLGDVVALQHAVRAGLDSTHLADLLPTTWSEFIRNADMTDVRPLGIREIEVQRPKFSL